MQKILGDEDKAVGWEVKQDWKLELRLNSLKKYTLLLRCFAQVLIRRDCVHKSKYYQNSSRVLLVPNKTILN